MPTVKINHIPLAMRRFGRESTKYVEVSQLLEFESMSSTEANVWPLPQNIRHQLPIANSLFKQYSYSKSVAKIACLDPVVSQFLVVI